MDVWPTFWENNRPLYEKMIAGGFWFKRGKELAHFVDASGEYANFPAGYITGVQCSFNGSPRPYTASVYNGEAWLQRSFADRQAAVNWAFESARQILSEEI